MPINKAIQPYYNYYERLYKPEILGNQIIIEIPIKDGSSSLDHYYINPLLKQGYKYHEDFLLGVIYLIKNL